ncbi:MAG: hypothetical protein Q4B92_05235 [Ruminococcus sp.]|nr:hypothetical protein [Ruminococcus sp.]
MVKELTLAGGVITPVKVKSGMKPVTGVTCDISKSALLPKSGNAEIESKITVAEELEAPVEAGTKVGKVSFLYEGSTVDEFDIVTTESVEKISFKSVFGFLLCKLFEF